MEAPEPAARNKQPRQQLSKGMEHMRYAVTVPNEPANAGLLATPTARVGDVQETGTPTASEAKPQELNEAESPAYGVPSHYQPLRRPTTDAAANPQKRSDPFQFGSRFLEEGDDIFAYNAWDHVEVDDAYKTFVEAQTTLQRDSPVSDFDRRRFSEKPEKWWDKFYGNNGANFFKDRRWLGQEFPLLGEVTAPDYGPVTVLEIGAGAGNTAFPIVAMNKNEGLRLHACDYSKNAVDVMRRSELYDETYMRADVWDVAAEGEERLPPGIEEGTVDVVIMIFVFSAIAPSQWHAALQNVWRVLKPGGSVLFRDYGRGDLAQVRFKKGRYLEENFYVRGDGTRVYFFEEEELRSIWTGKSELLDGSTIESLSEKLGDATDESGNLPVGRPRFQVLKLGTDRRMLVNRQRRLKMYRCWMQGLFEKPSS